MTIISAATALSSAQMRILLALGATLLLTIALLAAAVDQEMTIPGNGWSLPATLVLPESGPAPCVVFFAGSGPTDRDWKSPLQPGTNGSAKQLAAALQAKGVGSIRFDKVGSGLNLPKSAAPEELKKLEVLSMAHYVDEANAAFEVLAKRPECGKVFLLGHSEGSVHAFSAAVTRQTDARFGGMISLAGPSRSILDTVIEQIRARHKTTGDDLAAIDRQLTAFRSAMVTADAPAPDLSMIPEAVALWQMAHSPAQQRVARELLLTDPLVSVKAYRGRALIVSAGHDAQVSVPDGDRIFSALPGDATSKTRAVIANANHVFKGDPRDPASLSPQQISAAYTDEGRQLADGIVDRIVAFVSAK